MQKHIATQGVKKAKEQKQKQQMNLRTVARYALVTFLLSAMLLGGVLGVHYCTNVRADRKSTETKESNVIELQKQTIVRTLKLIVSDVMVLSQLESLRKVLDGHEDSKNELANDFFAFSERKRCYDQVRYLDETGMEIVRVNFNRHIHCCHTEAAGAFFAKSDKQGIYEH